MDKRDESFQQISDLKVDISAISGANASSIEAESFGLLSEAKQERFVDNRHFMESSDRMRTAIDDYTPLGKQSVYDLLSLMPATPHPSSIGTSLFDIKNRQRALSLCNEDVELYWSEDATSDVYIYHKPGFCKYIIFICRYVRVILLMTPLTSLCFAVLKQYEYFTSILHGVNYFWAEFPGVKLHSKGDEVLTWITLGLLFLIFNALICRFFLFKINKHRFYNQYKSKINLSKAIVNRMIRYLPILTFKELLLENGIIHYTRLPTSQLTTAPHPTDTMDDATDIMDAHRNERVLPRIRSRSLPLFGHLLSRHTTEREAMVEMHEDMSADLTSHSYPEYLKKYYHLFYKFFCIFGANLQKYNKNKLGAFDIAEERIVAQVRLFSIFLFLLKLFDPKIRGEIKQRLAHDDPSGSSLELDPIIPFHIICGALRDGYEKSKADHQRSPLCFSNCIKKYMTRSDLSLLLLNVANYITAQIVHHDLAYQNQDNEDIIRSQSEAYSHFKGSFSQEINEIQKGFCYGR